MAGHSKWANIKHKKERSDAKRGKIFSRLSKEIISAVKVGGEDPKGNPRLRLALQKARAANFPSDNIERVIKKATDQDQSDYEELSYELYGHGGVGLILDIMTDNRNRIASEIRIATNKRGGTVANPGAVSYNFDRKGVIQISTEEVEEEALFFAATDAGAEDFSEVEGSFVILTDPTELYAVKEQLEEGGFTCASASLDMIPKVWIECNEEDRQANLALIEWLEEIDDIDTVYHNIDM